MWKQSFAEAAGLGYKVAVCDRRGHIIAIANCGHVLNDVRGERWHEFVEDLPRVLAWFARDDEEEAITYAQLGHACGVPTRQWITLVKRGAGALWICYGSVRHGP
jgi:hypothetical protein